MNQSRCQIQHRLKQLQTRPRQLSEEHYYNSPTDYAQMQEPKVWKHQIVTSWLYESVEVGSSIFDRH